MELQEFITKFAEQFEETDAGEIKAETEFKNLAKWSSLMALSIIAMIDDEYEVTVKGDDMRSSKTIEDLYRIVKGKV
ncbi:acyl carrier protein [Spirochaetia bacterium]|nr:acyl carrier protein [Spirochaetia bacterium]